MVRQLIAQRVLAMQQALRPFFDTVLRDPAAGGPLVCLSFVFSTSPRGRRQPPR
jgi:hypothetical protein